MGTMTFNLLTDDTTSALPSQPAFFFFFFTYFASHVLEVSQNRVQNVTALQRTLKVQMGTLAAFVRLGVH